MMYKQLLPSAEQAGLPAMQARRCARAAVPAGSSRQHRRVCRLGR